ncbi:SMAD/FHA domain-containing protein [Stachybotrys elegans]|uniref:SMAD/FHA domain-containing protein n=1 Tax=Stachybotrys elegans TaxID=80388 RepID=A0A8K0SRY2_9HYPO|nr:SMAD/FHA domain-containing protein [Stachybotrys elegans]
MASDHDLDDRPERPRDDGRRRDRHDRDERRHRSHRDEKRHRSRDRSDRHHRRRSRTPDSSSRRSHRRDEDADEDRHRRRRRSRDDKDSDRRRRRRDDNDDDDDDDEKRRKDSGRSVIKRNGPLPSQEASFAITNGEEPEKPKEKPNYGTTGLLAAASNSVTQADGTTIALKYHEPSEARKPSPRDQWTLFVFKDGDIVDTVNLSSRSCWLIGREMAVVDLPAEHPSISKQHAVIQFRYTEKRSEFGDKVGKVKPYLIDLESANGTRLNDEKVPESRYLELRDKDMVQFGQSTREYVIMLAPRD